MEEGGREEGEMLSSKNLIEAPRPLGTRTQGLGIGKGLCAEFVITCMGSTASEWVQQNVDKRYQELHPLAESLLWVCGGGARDKPLCLLHNH